MSLWTSTSCIRYNLKSIRWMVVWMDFRMRVRVVNVYWNDDKRNVNDWNLDENNPWNADNRVLSRNRVFSPDFSGWEFLFDCFGHLFSTRPTSDPLLPAARLSLNIFYHQSLEFPRPIAGVISANLFERLLDQVNRSFHYRRHSLPKSNIGFFTHFLIKHSFEF